MKAYSRNAGKKQHKQWIDRRKRLIKSHTLFDGLETFLLKLLLHIKSEQRLSFTKYMYLQWLNVSVCVSEASVTSRSGQTWIVSMEVCVRDWKRGSVSSVHQRETSTSTSIAVIALFCNFDCLDCQNFENFGWNVGWEKIQI